MSFCQSRIRPKQQVSPSKKELVGRCFQANAGFVFSSATVKWLVDNTRSIPTGIKYKRMKQARFQQTGHSRYEVQFLISQCVLGCAHHFNKFSFITANSLHSSSTNPRLVEMIEMSVL